VEGQLVTGLTPGAGYEVTLRARGAVLEVTIAPGAAQRADQAGVLALGILAKR
jgi:hypothetical protein